MFNFQNTNAMKKMIQIAAIAAITGLATFANAQTAVTGNASGTVDATIDSMQVDFVTVGATMPYKTAVNANNAAWLTELAGLGFTDPAAAGELTTKWAYSTGGAFTNLVPAGSEVDITWPTAGKYLLRAQSSYADACASESFKNVYVLPKPSVAITDGDKEILACDVTSHNVEFTAKGIGEKQVKYTVTRKPVGAAGTTGSAEDEAVGDGVTTAETFTEAVTDYAAATAYYTGDGDAENITVGSLTPGYIYTVTITEVSDQISRKSGVTVDGLAVKAVFTVTPKPTSTKINHIKNVE